MQRGANGLSIVIPRANTAVQRKFFRPALGVKPVLWGISVCPMAVSLATARKACDPREAAAVGVLAWTTRSRAVDAALSTWRESRRRRSGLPGGPHRRRKRYVHLRAKRFDKFDMEVPKPAEPNLFLGLVNASEKSNVGVLVQGRGATDLDAETAARRGLTLGPWP